MKNHLNSNLILTPNTQLTLFGYKYYFDFFAKLFKKNKLPNTLLLNGPKGIGKCTFVYHFVNYILSMNDEKKYSLNEFKINEDNQTYKLVKLNSHPNFFKIDNNLSEKEIKIDQARELLKFLNKSTYLRDLKIVLIDNAENLNLNSSNALLKSLEEPKENTFFFIIQNNSDKILNTIKSRTTEFKFFFNQSQKNEILKSIFNQYEIREPLVSLAKDFYFDTPGNIIKYFLILYNGKIDINNKIACINFFMNLYQNEKKIEILNFLSIFVEKLHHELCLHNNNNFMNYFYNHSKIINQINYIKKFKLQEKNVFITIKNLLKNEKK